MAGAGLAVALAYLALDRFRYRDAVERCALQKYRDFESSGANDGSFEAMRDLRWLCRNEENGHTPRGFKANFYHYFFRNKLDEIIIAMVGALSGCTLIGGVALNADVAPLSLLAASIDSRWTCYLFFYACMMAIVLPAIAVLCGRGCVAWGSEFTDYCSNEINTVLKNSARQASIPPFSSDAFSVVREALARRNAPPDM